MILRLLCRAYYEVEGTWNGFPHMHLLQDLVDKNGTSLAREFYREIGYVDDDVATSVERYELRKLHAEDDLARLESRLKVSGRRKISSILKTLEALSDKDKAKVVEPHPWTPIIRLLSEYFMTDQSLVLNVNKAPTSFGDYLFAQTMSGKKVTDGLMANASLLGVVKQFMPSFVVSKDLPSISQGYLFSDFKPTEKNIDQLAKAVLEQCLTKNQDLHESIYFTLVSNIISYQLSKEKEYLRYLDWAHMLGVSVKKMIELCGLEYVNRLDYYKEHKIFPYGASGNYIVFGENSTDSKKYIKVTGEQLVNLTATESLKTLEFTEEGPTIYMGERLLLSSIYMGGPVDFTRGVL